ncbi:hypothetical protein [Marinifilum flexuosum]|uniref:hypothetical protein n=1 Tax=Marinifilum flexuosum TaxID=1117708 RepID=UPI0024907FBC|nr:hypothetical protein [Marinifilum flexuosum]
MSKNKTHISTKFNFCEIHLTAYSGQTETFSSDIVRTEFNLIQKNKSKGSVKFFDKNKNNDGEPRYIGILSSAYLFKERVIKGKMALLRSKNPVLVDDNYNIEKIKELENKKFAEISHFCIDYSNNIPVLIFEKNMNGPNLNDLEYFLRHFGRENNIGKYCKIKPFIEAISDKLIENITGVEFIDLKVNQQKKAVLENVAPSYYSSANYINSTTPYKNLRITTHYDKTQPQKGVIELAKNFFRGILNNSEEADDYELLQISYELQDSGEFNKFDLLRDKKGVTLEVETSAPGVPKSKQLFSKMIQELKLFKP